MIINLFCDASIDLNTHVACGGCCAVIQNGSHHELISYRRIIQKEGTNNSSEILAVWVGIVHYLKLRKCYPGAIFRLFSDSKVSLYGLRDWLKNWIGNITSEGILLSSSNQPVANQQRFIDIFNMIVENNIYVEFYHQRGHVKDGKVTLDKARTQFIRANKVSPEMLGLNIDILSYYNDIIDNLTREAVRAYIDYGNILPYTEIEGITPFIYNIRKEMLPKYLRNTRINRRRMNNVY